MCGIMNLAGMYTKEIYEFLPLYRNLELCEVAEKRKNHKNVMV
jgi:hypothetical protein